MTLSRYLALQLVACGLLLGQFTAPGNAQFGQQGFTPPVVAKTFSLSQSVITNFSCAGTTAEPSCAVTATIAAGHTLVFISAVGVVAGGIAYSSATGDTFTHCPASASILFAQAQWIAVDCAYVLSATGGTNTYTFGWTGSAPTFWIEDVWLFDLSWPGSSVTYDGGGAIVGSTSCSSCTGPSLSGFTAGDTVFQLGGSINGILSALSGGYTHSSETSQCVCGAAGWLLNAASYTAPVWTTTKGGVVLGAVAFKGN